MKVFAKKIEWRDVGMLLPEDLTDAKVILKAIKRRDRNNKAKNVGMVIIVLLALICLPIAVNALTQWTPTWCMENQVDRAHGILCPNGKDTDWISFFGNYSGGILGGIVTFITLKISFRNERYKIFMEQREYALTIIDAYSDFAEKIPNLNTFYIYNNNAENLQKYVEDFRSAKDEFERCIDDYLSLLKENVPMIYKMAKTSLENVERKYQSLLQSSSDHPTEEYFAANWINQEMIQIATELATYLAKVRISMVDYLLTAYK